jgi:hypothetical protein
MNEERMALLSLAEYQQTLERVQRLEALCARAADALEYQQRFIHEHCCDGYPNVSDLIAQLRERRLEN